MTYTMRKNVLFFMSIIININAATMLTTPESEDGFLLEGDIVLNREQLEAFKAALISGTLDGVTASNNQTNIGGRNALIDEKSRWPNGTIYYSFDQNLPDRRRKTVRASLSDLQSRLSGCLKFKEKDNGKRVVVTRDASSCKTHVGYQHQSNSDIHKLWLADACSFAAIQHEFLHTAGIWHTQSRWDRDEYVTIKKERIIDGMEHNFNKYSKNFITHYGMPYDYESLMHYQEDAFSNGKGPTIVTKDASNQEVIGQTDGASKGDIELVQHMYGCLKECKTKRGPKLAKCIFPFKYNGVSYNGCTTKVRRCATKVKDNGEMMTKDDWGYCEDLCPVHRDCKTTDNTRCIFPFIYQGQRYNSCTTEKYDQEWCATKVDSNSQFIPENWGDCGLSCP